MDTLDVTGLVMTASLNSVITDSSPGMAAYVTGQKNANNQEGVFPDNTADPFDNPRDRVSRRAAPPHARRRVQRRHRDHRGPDRLDAGGQRGAHVRPLRGRRHRRAVLRRARDQRRHGADGRRRASLLPAAAGGSARTTAQLAEEFDEAGYTRVSNATEVASDPGRRRRRAGMLGLFHSVAHARRVRQGRRRPLQRRTGAAERTRPTATRRCSRTWRSWRCSRCRRIRRPGST